MRPYTFCDYCRDVQRLEKAPLPHRISMWLLGLYPAGTIPEQYWQVVVDMRRVAEAVNRAMNPAERADPLTISDERRADLAKAACVTEEELATALLGYESQVRLALDREETTWWHDGALQALAWVMLPFVALIAAGKFVLGKIRQTT